MSSVKTYNCKQVKITLGTHIVSGYAEDSFLTIAALGDGTSSQTGADGSVVRAISPDLRHSLKLTLQQTSPTLAWIRKKRKRDVEDGEGMFSVMVKNLTGDEIFSANDAWVVKNRDTAYGNSVGTREVEIHTAEGEWEDS